MKVSNYISNMSIETLLQPTIVFQKDDPGQNAHTRLVNDYGYPVEGLNALIERGVDPQELLEAATDSHHSGPARWDYMDTRDSITDWE